MKAIKLESLKGVETVNLDRCYLVCGGIISYKIAESATNDSSQANDVSNAFDSSTSSDSSMSYDSSTTNDN